jgi:hypothetical protein
MTSRGYEASDKVIQFSKTLFIQEACVSRVKEFEYTINLHRRAYAQFLRAFDQARAFWRDE